MANCTYTIRRPNAPAYAEGVETLASAADYREQANRNVAPRHQICAEWGNVVDGEREVTSVDEDDVQRALVERAALHADDGAVAFHERALAALWSIVEGAQ